MLIGEFLDTVKLNQTRGGGGGGGGGCGGRGLNIKNIFKNITKAEFQSVHHTVFGRLYS